jgi:hypothetical protein
MTIERLLYAGNNLQKARELFDAAVKRRPRPAHARAAAVAGAVTLIPLRHGMRRLSRAYYRAGRTPIPQINRPVYMPCHPKSPN